MQQFAGCQVQWPKRFEDRSENEGESYTKQLVLKFARGFIFCWKYFFFFMQPSLDDSQVCTDKCSSDLQLLIQQEISYGVASMLVRSLAFPQRAAAMPGARSTSLQKRYCSETSLVPKSRPSAASDGSYLRTVWTPKPPSASQSGLLPAPTPPGVQVQSVTCKMAYRKSSGQMENSG